MLIEKVRNSNLVEFFYNDIYTKWTHTILIVKIFNVQNAHYKESKESCKESPLFIRGQDWILK